MNSDVVLAACLGCFFLLILALSFALPFQSAVLPGVTAFFGLLLCCFVIVRGVSGVDAKPSITYSLIDVKKLAGLGVAITLLMTLGFPVGGFLLVFLYLRYVGKVPRIRSFLLASIAPLFIVVIFHYTLRLEVYPGLISCLSGLSTSLCN